MTPQALRSLFLQLALASLLWAGFGQVQVQATQSVAVGEVTLAIGLSDIGRETETAAPVLKGKPIREGDVIKTSASGHVHVRFKDGALVSVRPNSVFTIHEFKYNPAEPAASVVRLSLSKGEVRSISGAAAQAAKERFRLNTPLVAIGVKGTDFVTQTGQDATRVTVNQGAIVMAPFDQGCRADTLGVCATSRARELTAAMTGMALEYRNGTVDPGFQLAPAQKENNKLQPQDGQLKDNADRASSASKESVRPEELVSVSRLVWGRWNQVPAPGDNLTIGFRAALSGNEVTVGDGYYFLFRNPGSPNLLPSLTNQVDFKLTSSAAQYRPPSNNVVAATVNSGIFSIDFAQSTYVTQLQVSAEGISPQNLQFAGKIDTSTGIFRDTTPKGLSLGGALTLNGLQAGYFFRAPVNNGSLTGATLWGR
ncbi:FecR family protein [Limnohabitans sp.]|uniref:FecR family protein n=1 Tax=Limnohabitans sp. TaxID=1907725 RepID=UPI002AFF07ED|nr:FecR family protein [Limnohabitans sp.]